MINIFSKIEAHLKGIYNKIRFLKISSKLSVKVKLLDIFNYKDYLLSNETCKDIFMK